MNRLRLLGTFFLLAASGTLLAQESESASFIRVVPFAGYQPGPGTTAYGARVDYVMPFGKRWSVSPGIQADLGSVGDRKPSISSTPRVPFKSRSTNYSVNVPVNFTSNRISVMVISVGAGYQHAAVGSDWDSKFGYSLSSGISYRLGPKDYMCCELFIQTSTGYPAKVTTGVRLNYTIEKK